MKDTTQQSVLFDGLIDRPLVASFDQPDSSSDAGALLLKACDERLGLSTILSGCIKDSRQSSKVRHTVSDLLRQRVYALACGCLLYTSPSPRDRTRSRMPSSA